MGQQIPGTKEIKYKTKDGTTISYIFYDLKGKNRFPSEPSNEAKVNAMFEMALSEIDATPDQLNEIKSFNNKYRYRFYVMHKKKMEEQSTRNSVNLLRQTSNFVLENHKVMENENKSEMKKKSLEQKLKEIQTIKGSLKMPLAALDKIITDQKAHYQFVQIDGITRTMQVLQKQIKTNSQGYKTNFSNQIDILRFLKSYSSHHPKQFYCNIETNSQYGNVLMDAFHPVCTPVTAYALSLLEDYIWRAEDCKNIITILTEYAKKEKYANFFTVFVEALESSNNVLMVFYILKFVNQVMAGTVDEAERGVLKKEMNQVKYSFVIEAIKMRLEQQFYKIETCTFISVSQQIFKYASKGKKQYQNSLNNPQTSFLRNTVNIKQLQQQLVLNFFEMGTKESQKQQQQNQQQFMAIYLNQSSTKQFNRYILEVVSQIRSYYKLQAYTITTLSEEEEIDEEKHKIFVENKLEDLKQEQYIKYIRTNCIKNDCTNEMLNIFRNLQYLEKGQVKKLENYILEEMNGKNTDESEGLKKSLREKEDLIKKLLKENIDLKEKVKEKEKLPPPPPISSTNSSIPDSNYFSSSPSLPQPPSLSSTLGLPTPPSLPAKLPPPPPLKNNGLPTLPPPPSLDNFLPPPPSLDSILGGSSLPPPPPLKNTGLPTLPPPPSLDNFLPPPPSLDSILGGSSLPPPPPLKNTGLPTLPPPPSLDNFLPPPPSLDSILGGSSLPPPPPSLSATLGSLPPPPSLDSVLGGSLPPPPSLDSVLGGSLPPPPSLDSVLGSLPPPPSLDSVLGSLPPPPSLSGLPPPPPPPPSLGGLPPPPPPPPSLGGLPLLPPPPPIGGLGLPPPPPPIGGLKLPPPPGLPGFHVIQTQKLKQKRKPNVPLKSCNYAVIPYSKILGTVWQQINDEKIDINTQQIEQLFAQKVKQVPKPQKKQQKLQKVSSMIKVQQKKQPIKLLSTQRWRNVQIILTKLKVQRGQISKNLIQCSGMYCNISNLESIKNILPLEDQEEIIKMYSGDVNQLGRPQAIFKEIVAVPAYASRVKAMIFGAIKEETYFELQQRQSRLLEAFNTVRNHSRFIHILQVTLAIGNYLNGTSLKGGAWGFKLDSIQRLEQVKSQDGKMNAAFYVIRQAWKKYSYPLFKKQQVDLSSYLSKTSTSQINLDIGELRSYLSQIKRAQNSKIPDNSEDNIGKFCEQMRIQLQAKIKVYEQEEKKIIKAFQQCSKFYGEETKKSDQFGSKIFKSFFFLSESEKTLKVVHDKQKKQQERKAVKSQIFIPSKKQQQIPSPPPRPSMNIVQKVGLPEPPKLVPKVAEVSKQEKLKQFEKAQQKAHDDMIKKRQTKVIAYRNSKMPKGPNGLKNDFDDISFLKGIK